MRIAASFTRRPRAAVFLSVGLGVTAMAFAVLAVWLAIDISDMREGQPHLEARLALLQTRLDAAAPQKSLPPMVELESVRRRVQALNRFSRLRGWSTPRLLAWFERRMPKEVYLASLHHRPREGEVLLVAESPSAAALTGFLLEMEKEPEFAQVLLSKQGVHRRAGATTVNFEIRVRLVP